MQHIADILLRKDFDEPPEVAAIKRFVERHFQSTPAVSIQPQQIVIEVRSASLAGALRMKLHELKKECGIDKKLFIRIG